MGHVPVVVSREPDDKLVDVRISIGGSKKTGYYLVFRGDPEEVVVTLKKMLSVAAHALPDGKYTDKRGRPQG